MRRSNASPSSTRRRVVIVKHANPVRRGERGDAGRGVGLRVALRSGLGLRRHRRGEPHADAAAAEKIAAIFTEVIIAPDADEAAKAVLARKKNLRLLLTGGLPDPADAGLTFRSVVGRLPGADARQRPDRAGRPEGGDEARADRG